MPTSAYRILRRVTPGQVHVRPARQQGGPASILLQKRPTVGVRIPDSAVALGLVRELGRPLLSTSVPQGDDDFFTDPQVIAETFRHDIDLILDAGVLANEPSTIIDLSGPAPVLLRAGAGPPSPSACRAAPPPPAGRLQLPAAGDIK